MALTFAMVDFGYALMLVLLALILSGIAALMHRRDRIVFAINTALYALFGLLSFLALVLSASSAIPLFSIFSISAFSLLFFVLFSFGIACVSVISYKRSEHFAHLSALMSFAFLGMVLVSASGSFVTTILGLELVSVSSAFMILLDGKSGLEASTKLFIIGAIAAAVMIFALALIFPFSGSLSFALAQNSGMNYILLTGILLFIVGLSFESGIFPFNLWIPDVYEGAKANVTAFISGLNENVGFAAIITVFFVAFVAYAKSYYMIFEILSIFTMFFGNIVAIVQKNVKRMFAYSAISQAGYVLVGISAATAFGIEASIFQVFAHMLVVIGIFAIIAWLESRNIRNVEDYTGLNWRNSFAAIALTIFMLSLLGIPPLIGFDGKLLLFSSALSANLLVLVLFGVLNSFISVYYYGRLIAAMYSKKEHQKMYFDWYTAAVVIACLAAVIAIGIYPSLLIEAAKNAALALSIL